MSEKKQPTLSVTVSNVGRLRDVTKWAELAGALGVPAHAAVSVDSLHDAVTVTAWLEQLEVPE